MSDAPFAYCAYYCEENCWQLVAHPGLAALERRVLFVSNATRSVALWSQRAAPEPGAPVLWDYHVVVLTRASGAPWQCWDLDCTLGAPVPLEAWLRASFPHAGRVERGFAPVFRLVDAEQYRRELRSDRGHMRDERGQWLAPPPGWPAPGEGGSNLAQWIDTEGEGPGQRLELGALVEWARG